MRLAGRVTPPAVPHTGEGIESESSSDRILLPRGFRSGVASLMRSVDAPDAATRHPVAGVGPQSAEHADEPGGAVVPPGHAEHDGDPAASANVFAGHCSHVLAPAVPANVPAGHGAHGSMPPGPNEPAGHVASVVVVTATHIADPSGAVVPGGHGVHIEDPGVSAKVSAGQALHTLEPAMSANVPAGHGEHGSAPPGP